MIVLSTRRDTFRPLWFWRHNRLLFSTSLLLLKPPLLIQRPQLRKAILNPQFSRGWRSSTSSEDCRDHTRQHDGGCETRGAQRTSPPASTHNCDSNRILPLAMGSEDRNASRFRNHTNALADTFKAPPHYRESLPMPATFTKPNLHTQIPQTW